MIFILDFFKCVSVLILLLVWCNEYEVFNIIFLRIIWFIGLFLIIKIWIFFKLGFCIFWFCIIFVLFCIIGILIVNLLFWFCWFFSDNVLFINFIICWLIVKFKFVLLYLWVVEIFVWVNLLNSLVCCLVEILILVLCIWIIKYGFLIV